MKQVNVKKLALANLPYAVIGLYASKLNLIHGRIIY